jgi:hypothetical protein
MDIPSLCAVLGGCLSAVPGERQAAEAALKQVRVGAAPPVRRQSMLKLL